MSHFTTELIPDDVWADLCSRPQYYRASLDGVIYDIRRVWRSLRAGAVSAEMLFADVTALFALVPEAVSNLEHCMRVRECVPLLGVEWVSPETTVEVRLVDGWHRIGRRMIDLSQNLARAAEPDAPCMTTCLLALADVPQFIVPDTNKAMHHDLCTDEDTQRFMAGVCAKHGVGMPVYFRLSQFMAEEDYESARQFIRAHPALMHMSQQLDMIV